LKSDKYFNKINAMNDLNIKNIMIQYEQLNERSRKYTAQSWIIPFSYFSIVGIIISFLKIHNLLIKSIFTSLSFFSLYAISYIILIHILSITFYNFRTIKFMQIIEIELNLFKTTKTERFFLLIFIINMNLKNKQSQKIFILSISDNGCRLLSDALNHINN